MDYNKLGKDILTQVGAKKMLAVLVTVSHVFALF